MMRKKHISLFILICVLCFCLVGCGNAIPEMTEKENALVTSYAAGLLLKYDTRYQTKLLNDEELAKEEEMQRKVQEEAERKAALKAEKEAKKKEEEAAKKSEQEEENVVSTNPAEVLGLNGFDVSFGGVDYMDSYPDSGDDLFFALQPSAGCKLAVVRLVLTNQASEAQTADILSANAKFKVSFNGGDYYNAMVTMLSDDFSVFSGELQSGESVNTVLLLDIKEEECVPVESAHLYIKCNGEAVKIGL